MLKELERRILASCADGHVELSVMLAKVAEASGASEPGSLRQKAMAIVTNLLDLGLIRAGRPTPDGKAFVAWNLESKESVARIYREWDSLGRAPKSGDIVWFAATKEGVRVVAAK